MVSLGPKIQQIGEKDPVHVRVEYIASATVLISHKNTKILTDPWLLGEEYYGSWAHYPPVSVNPEQFQDIDYIYISHIHPDHMSQKTLELFDVSIPILIHNYDAKFVKRNLESLGRQVIELNHGELFHCGDGLNMRIYAADDCNPEICYKFFGCGKMESKIGSTSIDTMAIIENGEKTILNVNDCPYDLSEKTLDRVMKDYPVIDMLLVGYTGAGSYPQCWHYTDQEKLEIYGKKKKMDFLEMGSKFINMVKPKVYMPFAGTYTLRGKYSHLEKLKVAPTLEEALAYYSVNSPGQGILLNCFEWYDLEKEKVSREYEPINPIERENYIERVLSKHKYEYEYDSEPSLKQIIDLLPDAYGRYELKRIQINFQTTTNIYIFLPENKMCKISCQGHGYEIIELEEFNDDRYVTYKLDYKLLHRILKGPRYAHWNNAEIGSHIMFSRKPEIYERGLYYSMNYFHK